MSNLDDIIFTQSKQNNHGYSIMKHCKSTKCNVSFPQDALTIYLQYGILNKGIKMTQTTISADPLSFSPSQEMSNPLLELRYCMDPSSPHVPLHAHMFYEFYVFVRGDLERYVVGQKNYNLVPGDVLVIPPMVLHRPFFRRNNEQNYHRYYFWVTKEHMELLSSFSQSNYFLRCCSEQDEFLIHPPELLRRRILKLLKTAWEEVTTQQICNDLYLQAHFFRFIADINNSIRFSDGQLKDTSNQHNDLMEKILAHIHDNYSEELSLHSVADRFHVSISTIENMFNRITGKPFYNYVTEYRIITAQAMILDGMPLQQVSRECGYLSYSNFYKVFVKRVGCNPSNFRQSSHPPFALEAQDKNRT